MKNQISPSIMCVDFFALKESIAAFERAGIEYIHVDIMDGHFVPNLALGTDFIRQLKSHTAIPLDIHLMVDQPDEMLHWLPFGEGDYVGVHIEAAKDFKKSLSLIHARGAKTMAVLSPETPISVLEDYFDLLDGILVMTVYPGFAGQKMVEETLPKIADLRALLDERGYPEIEIECDGNVSFENAARMKAAGANIFVGGSSSVFAKDGTVEENIQKLRKIVE